MAVPLVGFTKKGEVQSFWVLEDVLKVVFRNFYHIVTSHVEVASKSYL
ncbi:MAG: hypothetical protein ACKPEO_02190 [Sphaerospermopsis kisseleviana]|nr:hypothetical protein [Sphaerospermopsis sp. LEGE 00249]